jgi:hypothetical protein
LGEGWDTVIDKTGNKGKLELGLGSVLGSVLGLELGLEFGLEL